MSGKFIALFLLVAVYAATVMCNPPPPPPKCPPPTPRPIKCPKNEIWTKCKNPCEPSCKMPKRQPCILSCSPGCQCRKGLLRNKWGKCVEPCDC